MSPPSPEDIRDLLIRSLPRIECPETLDLVSCFLVTGSPGHGDQILFTTGIARHVQELVFWFLVTRPGYKGDLALIGHLPAHLAQAYRCLEDALDHEDRPIR
jgi:hypothetical protein